MGAFLMLKAAPSAAKETLTPTYSTNVDTASAVESDNVGYDAAKLLFCDVCLVLFFLLHQMLDVGLANTRHRKVRSQDIAARYCAAKAAPTSAFPVSHIHARRGYGAFVTESWAVL